MKHFAAAAVLTGLVSFVGSADAYSNAPTFVGHSGLASSDASGDVNIALHKAVLSAAIEYTGPGSDNANATEHPENAFDGDDHTSTGKAGNITVDLGAVYVVDSIVVKFASVPTQYTLAWSPYLGATALPATYDLATGLGSVPASETANQDYRDFLWINDAKPIDERKLAAQPARFLNFHFNPVYNGTWSNGIINEIEIHGHPYVPSAGDEAFLSRTTWLPTAFADAAPGGEGQTVTHAIDGELTNPWRPQTAAAVGQWYQIDLGESATFNQIYVVFAIGGVGDTPNAFNLFASDDTANWGAPIAQLDYGESTTKTFALQKKRYLRLERAIGGPDWWQIDELNLLAPASADGVGPGNSMPGASAGSAGTGVDSGGMANPTPGLGGTGGGGASSLAGGGTTTANTPGGGGANPVSAGAGATNTLSQSPSTAGGCSFRGAPHRNDSTSLAALLVVALGAIVLQARSESRKRRGYSTSGSKNDGDASRPNSEEQT